MLLKNSLLITTHPFFDHHRRLAKEYPDGVEVFQGDIMDDVAVTEAMAHCDSWIHLAAVLGTQETIKNPRPAAKSNLIGGLNILEAGNLLNTISLAHILLWVIIG